MSFINESILPWVSAGSEQNPVSPSKYFQLTRALSLSLSLSPLAVPLAVVAAVTVILHPLIFIAGAATAFGAVHMMGHGLCLIGEDRDGTQENDVPATMDSSMSTSIPTSVLEAVQPSPTFETMLSEEGDGEDLPHDGDWLDVHFPPLGAKVVTDVQFEGLNALEFYKVFIGDDAPYTFKVRTNASGSPFSEAAFVVASPSSPCFFNPYISLSL